MAALVVLTALVLVAPDPPPAEALPGGDGPTTFQPLEPSRLFDTRSGLGGVPARRRAAGETLTFAVAGTGGVPATGARAVALNVTVTGPLASGFVTVHPCSPTRPLVSNLNHTASQTVANAVIAPVSATGTVCFYTEAATHLVVDVNGWFPDDTNGFTTLAPSRLFDTRSGLGGVPVQRVPSSGTLAFDVRGRNGLPPSGIAAVALNVTATGATEAGFVTVHPCGETRPLVSNLNYLPGQASANSVVVRVPASGSVCFYAERAVHLVADVHAWFAPGGALTPVSPSRLVDTREAAAAPLRSFTPVPQVTGGSAISIGQVPWQVRVVVQGTSSCGGSLIHERWVATAAHCVVAGGVPAAPTSVRIWAGQTFTSAMSNQNAVGVQRVIVHPSYGASAYTYDLALLELAAPASGGVPIHLHTDTAGPARLTPALISGWGETVAFSPPPDQLHAATLYVRAGPGEPCGQWADNYVPSIMICASGGVSQPDGAGGCRGDSGGPLALGVPSAPRLAGVVSFGAEFCPNDHDAPTVFTRVAALVPWIRSHAPAPGQLQDDVLRVQVAGRGGVPASGAAAAILNVTATGTRAAGFLTVFPCGAVPLASNLNTVPGRAVPNLVLAPLSPTGEVCVYSPTATHVVVDVFGWLAA